MVLLRAMDELCYRAGRDALALIRQRGGVLRRDVSALVLTILFLHQGRIIPSWLDKFAPWRNLSSAARSRLLLVYPSPQFVSGLPGGAVTTRDDFQRFVREPERRIERWSDAARQSDALGSAFVRDAESGALAAQVRGFD